MPNALDHLEQAERNEDFYTELSKLNPAGPEYTEWELVALFYAALHYVDAWLARSEGSHPRNHRQRLDMVMKRSAFRPISEDYATLYRLSIRARYEMERLAPDAIRNIESNEFLNIKRHIRTLLGVERRLPRR